MDKFTHIFQDFFLDQETLKNAAMDVVRDNSLDVTERVLEQDYAIKPYHVFVNDLLEESPTLTIADANLLYYNAMVQSEDLPMGNAPKTFIDAFTSSVSELQTYFENQEVTATEVEAWVTEELTQNPEASYRELVAHIQEVRVDLTTHDAHTIAAWHYLGSSADGTPLPDDYLDKSLAGSTDDISDSSSVTSNPKIEQNSTIPMPAVPKSGPSDEVVRTLGNDKPEGLTGSSSASEPVESASGTEKPVTSGKPASGTSEEPDSKPASGTSEEPDTSGKLASGKSEEPDTPDKSKSTSGMPEESASGTPKKLTSGSDSGESDQPSDSSQDQGESGVVADTWTNIKSSAADMLSKARTTIEGMSYRDKLIAGGVTGGLIATGTAIQMNRPSAPSEPEIPTLKSR